MPLVILDGSTVRDFVKDAQAFSAAMETRFKEMDLNEDGSLSRSELRKAFERMRLLECSLGFPIAQSPAQLNALYDSVFEQFDTDKSGNVDLEEFKVQMSGILLAIAEGLGSSPIQVLIEDGGILQDAVKHEEGSST